jgi:hypothetical protein
LIAKQQCAFVLMRVDDDDDGSVRGTRTSTIRVSPGECIAANMEVEHQGTWLLKGTAGDGDKGMMTLYTVS